MPKPGARKYELPFLQGALAERSPAEVATALKLTGGSSFISELAACKEFQPIIKATIEETAAKIQERWSPRLAVLLMSDLQLSRSQFDALRHYLSYAYDVDDDTYSKLQLYVNPFNPQKTVPFPSLPPRKPREAERNMLYGLCGVESSEVRVACHMHMHMRCPWLPSHAHALPVAQPRAHVAGPLSPVPSP